MKLIGELCIKMVVQKNPPAKKLFYKGHRLTASAAEKEEEGAGENTGCEERQQPV